MLICVLLLSVMGPAKEFASWTFCKAPLPFRPVPLRVMELPPTATLFPWIRSDAPAATKVCFPCRVAPNAPAFRMLSAPESTKMSPLRVLLLSAGEHQRAGTELDQPQTALDGRGDRARGCWCRRRSAAWRSAPSRMPASRRK